MRVEIYKPKEIPKVEPKVLRLELEQQGENVVLRAVDKDGDPLFSSSILSIGTDGRLYLHRNIGESVPVQKDAGDRIRVHPPEYFRI